MTQKIVTLWMIQFQKFAQLRKLFTRICIRIIINIVETVQPGA